MFKMKNERTNYVCTVCSETFTRKPSAKRHSDNNHSGTAPFVKFIDYIVGRIEGRYQPSDPLLYRHRRKDKKSQNNGSYSLENYKDAKASNKSASQFTTIPDKTIKESYSQVIAGKSDLRLKNNNNDNDNKEDREVGTYIPTDGPTAYGIKGGSESKSQRNQRDSFSSSGASNSQLPERTLRFQGAEFVTLVRKYYSDDNATEILNCANYFTLGGDDEFLNEKLVFLRNFDSILTNKRTGHQSDSAWPE